MFRTGCGGIGGIAEGHHRFGYEVVGESEFSDDVVPVESAHPACSQSFGEGLEQREFDIDDGEGYLSFWNSGSDYFVKNETEFRQYLNNQSMGGLQL